MSKIYTLLFSCITVQLLCATAWGTPHQRVFKLGYVTDLSGKGVHLGSQSRAGAELAVEELKKMGRNVQIIFGDSQLDTKIALTEAQKLLFLDHVDALMSDFTPPTVAISSVAHNAKKILLYQAPVMSVLESNPYAFKNFLDYDKGCEQIVSYWRSIGKKRIGNIKLNMEFGELCLAGSRRIFPDILVVDYNSGDDLRTPVLLFKNKGIEAFLHTAYENDMLNRLKVASEIGYHAPGGGPEPLLTKLVMEQGGLEGTVVFGYPGMSEEFLKKIGSKFPNHSTVNIESAAIAYMHVKQLVSALESCPENNVECQIEKLAKSSPDPTLSFKGWSNRVAQYDYTLKTWQNGRLFSISGDAQ